MELNFHKEEFSLAYVHAVVAVAGYVFQAAPRQVDMDGVDVLVKETSGRRSSLDIQIKCTADNSILNIDKLSYPVKISTYKRLSADCITPVILVVVLVPKTIDKWILFSEEELSLKGCGYWLSLSGYPSNYNRESVTISIPRSNIFNVDNLCSIIEKVSRGEGL
ncbi:DUF4365 domain-containing protein [Candidatus Cyanaurora vandensis]|uniref:DUF4365 domain-containing protein n=1 Tax=Candidatus Cyanaurora vandensis TaxID=2714958 RepID=UPI00257AEA11|nr:DUF4365 domain-containing protein [Candidatus Cyanaurora vandensis]